jgi:hypothetical protein
LIRGDDKQGLEEVIIRLIGILTRVGAYHLSMHPRRKKSAVKRLLARIFSAPQVNRMAVVSPADEVYHRPIDDPLLICDILYAVPY